MHSSSILFLFVGSGLAIAESHPDTARMMLRGRNALLKRQTTYCSGPGTTCESQCGQGYEICMEFPYCFNPSKGEICCSGGDYCDAGNYCTDNGCCPSNSTLAQCYASATVATLAGGSSAPPGPSSSGAAASSSMPGDAASRQVTNAASMALGAFILGLPFW